MNTARHAPVRLRIRAIREDDFAAWKPLWKDYNAFYGRDGDTALPETITQTTWHRFFDPDEPVFALVAETQKELLGFTHYLFHRSTTQVEPICYLEDLFTSEPHRGRGVGRALIDGVCQTAKAAGAKGVYWQTRVTNTAARRLYDTLAENRGFIVYSLSDSIEPGTIEGVRA